MNQKMKAQNLSRNERVAARLFQVLFATFMFVAAIVCSVIFSPALLFNLVRKNWTLVAPILLVALIAIITISAMIVLPILSSTP